MHDCLGMPQQAYSWFVQSYKLCNRYQYQKKMDEIKHKRETNSVVKVVATWKGSRLSSTKKIQHSQITDILAKKCNLRLYIT